MTKLPSFTYFHLSSVFFLNHMLSLCMWPLTAKGTVLEIGIYLLGCLFFFFPTLNKDSEGGIVEWLIHSFHLPMLGIFALMCPFQVDLLSFFLHLWYLLGICLCIHGLCWASFTVTSVSVTLHLLLLLPVLIFLSITCMSVMLSWFFSFIMT